MKIKTIFLLAIMFSLLLTITACQTAELTPAVSTEAPTASAAVQITNTQAVLPTSTPSLTPTPTTTFTPTPTQFLDLGSALVSPADSMDFLMDYGPMDTWVDEVGMHAGLESFYQDGPGTRITLDCARVPYSNTRHGTGGMKELSPEVVFGYETHIFVQQGSAYMYFFQGNCRAEIYIKQPYGLDGKLDEDTRRQLEGMAVLIQERLEKISAIDEGLSLPLSREVDQELFDETFYSLIIYHWGEPFRSYSVMLDTKKSFSKQITFGLFDTDKQEFTFKREIPNFPPMGPSLVDNLGKTVEHSGDETMLWEANYELYIWVEDDLLGIFPLEKYDQPK